MSKVLIDDLIEDYNDAQGIDRSAPPPTATRRELERICAENGGVLRPKTVVDEARPVGSPLHDHFEWNDGEAAEQYRLLQASRLIRICVRMLPIDPNKGKQPTRVFVSLPDDRAKGGGYRKLEDVLNDPKRKDSLIVQAEKEMESFKRKYASLNVLKDVFNAMTEAQATIEGQKLKRERAKKRAENAEKRRLAAEKREAKLAAAAPAAKPARKRKVA